MNKAMSGFTLIELVVVITILGILAAFTFSRFVSLEGEAHKDALGASIRSAASQAHSMSLFQDNAATITMNGQTITMLNGYPDEASIDDALQDFTGFQYINAAVVKFQKIGAPIPGACKVSYAEALVGAVPVITVDTTGC